MTRPTKEQVDEALLLSGGDVQEHDDECWECECYRRTLSAEVVALRERLAAQTELVTLHKLDAAKLREEVASLERVRLQEAFAIDPAYFRKHVPGYDAIMATATYSTEAVDALVLALGQERYLDSQILLFVDAVRASREPKL